MANSITRSVREALLSELKADLPAKLSALGVPYPRDASYLGAKRKSVPGELLPCVMVESTGFAQPVGGFSAGSTSLGDRDYTYNVWALVLGNSEEQAQEYIEAYADCLDAVLSNNTLGLTRVVDTWVSRTQLSGAYGGASEQLQGCKAVVTVRYYHQVGDTTT